MTSHHVAPSGHKGRSHIHVATEGQPGRNSAQPAADGNVTEGLYRLADLLGEPAVSVDQAAMNRERGKGPKRARPARPAIIPVSPATWWRWVKSGKAPAPIKLSDGVTVWNASDIRHFLAMLAQ